jgi:hypothetical protein
MSGVLKHAPWKDSASPTCTPATPVKAAVHLELALAIYRRISAPDVHRASTASNTTRPSPSGNSFCPAVRHGEDAPAVATLDRCPPIPLSESAWPPGRGFNKIPTTLQRSSLNLMVTVQPQLAAETQ